MFSKIGQIIFKNEAVARTSDFTMGLEIEMHRIEESGEFSQEPYPSMLGDQARNPWITTDFLETMTEIVTPPAAYALDAMHYLYGLNTILRCSLAPGELLWPLSMPPKLPQDPHELRIASATPEKEAYLKDWAKRHRMAEGTPCGVHINLSLDQHIIDLVLDNFPQYFSSKMEVSNYLYAILAQGFIRYRWLFTYLFGASPIAEQHYFAPEVKLPHPIRSIRQSSLGFGTKKTGDYSSVANYVTFIQQGVKNKQFQNEAEFHGPVRFRNSGTLAELKQHGATYLELRMLDLDPSNSIGIKTETIRFIRLFASYLIMSPALKPQDVMRVLTKADQMNEEVAMEHPTSKCRYQAKALALLRSLESYANKIQLGPEYLEILYEFENRVENPQLTPSARLITQIKDDSLTAYALKQARRYQQSATETIISFTGFENQEYTAQELKAALFKGNWDPNLRRRSH